MAPPTSQDQQQQGFTRNQKIIVGVVVAAIVGLFVVDCRYNKCDFTGRLVGGLFKPIP